MTISLRDCVRCGAIPYKRSEYCRPCSDAINARIRRWLDGERFEKLAEFSQEVGVTYMALRQRIYRMKEGRA